VAGLGGRIGAAGKRWTAATFSIRVLLDAPVECLPHNLAGTEYTPMQAKRRSPNLATHKKEPKLSRSHAPSDLSPVEWQRGLRRQFGREQAFGLENLTSEPLFSEFRVSNPTSKSSYRVAIRSIGSGGNFCSCPDYATSELGTCKHIEFTLAQLEKKRGAKAAFALADGLRGQTA
jgi:hypothetical protein